MLEECKPSLAFFFLFCNQSQSFGLFLLFLLTEFLFSCKFFLDLLLLLALFLFLFHDESFLPSLHEFLATLTVNAGLEDSCNNHRECTHSNAGFFCREGDQIVPVCVLGVVELFQNRDWHVFVCKVVVGLGVLKLKELVLEIAFELAALEWVPETVLAKEEARVELTAAAEWLIEFLRVQDRLEVRDPRRIKRVLSAHVVCWSIIRVTIRFAVAVFIICTIIAFTVFVVLSQKGVEAVLVGLSKCAALVLGERGLRAREHACVQTRCCCRNGVPGPDVVHDVLV